MKFSKWRKWPLGNQLRLRWLIIATLLVTAFAILGWLVYRERDVLLSYDWNIQWEKGMLALFFYTIAIWLAAWVWADIMQALGVNLPLAEHFHYLSLSNLAKRLPGTVWYVVGRSELYRRHQVQMRVSSLASALELSASVVSGIVVSLIFALPILNRYSLSVIWPISILVILLILLHPRILFRFLRRFGIRTENIRYSNLLVWVIVHCGIWIIGGCLLFSIINMFANLGSEYLSYVIGSWSVIGVLTTLMVFFPSNLGATEVGLSLLLSAVVPSSIAVLTALSVRIMTILFEILWSILSIIVRGKTTQE